MNDSARRDPPGILLCMRLYYRRPAMLASIDEKRDDDYETRALHG